MVAGFHYREMVVIDNGGGVEEGVEGRGGVVEESEKGTLQQSIICFC